MMNYPLPWLKTPAYGAAQEINNVYVSIQDEKEAIIGVPYEIRIPNLKRSAVENPRF